MDASSDEIAGSHTPTVIVIGGLPGAGKTTHARRLSADLHVPYLGSDALGQIIGASRFFDARGDANPVGVAYDVVFGLCASFIASGVSVILDLNMAHPFQWQHLDAMKAAYPRARFTAIILRVPWATCRERIARRHAANPATEPAPEVFSTHQHIVDGIAFLERLDRPDIIAIDAAGDAEAVYAAIRDRVTTAGASACPYQVRRQGCGEVG